MEVTRHLIVGAGVSGLSMAAALRDQNYMIVEADASIGGYCKTVKTHGFTWDYSGHFFHFKHPDIETWLRERMPRQKVRVVQKQSYIQYHGALIDFPFQKNIHQLPKDEFLDCLHDVFFAERQRALTTTVDRDRVDAIGSTAEAAPAPTNFKEMLYARFGRSIAEKFLIPYNEKLYACDLEVLDKDAMGRFFPFASVDEIIRNMKSANNASYNSTFSYPEGGAIEYVNAIASEVRLESLSLNEAVTSIDLRKRVVTTTKREIQYEHITSSIPFNRLAKMCALPHDESAFTWNKVLVFNLGFDRKGRAGAHWIYYPSRSCSFYRIGFYDNIFDADRLSLYVEVGYPRDAEIDVDAMLARVLTDLRAEGVIDEHKLVAHHSVTMDPAYVHITSASMKEHARLTRIMSAHGVHSIGRYGGWTYCSIEDNIVEARALASLFNIA